jgi:fatty acid desaturase
VAADAALDAPTRQLARMVAAETMRPLYARTDRHAVALLAAHLGALAVSAALVWWSVGSWWVVPAVVVEGVVLVHLFALAHECAHRTAFRTRRWNDAAAWLAAVAVCLPPRFFRVEHTAHHAHTQDAGRDPQLITLPATLGRYAWLVVGGPYWWYTVRTMAVHGRGGLLPHETAFVPDGERAPVVREARVLLGVYALVGVVSVGTASALVVWLWLLPRLVGEPFMRVARLSEHAGRPRTRRITENTRTLRVPRPLRLLAWNMPYHAEHHAAPSVPFHALPRLHAEFGPHVAGRPGGYLAAQADIVRRIVRHEGPGL